MRTARKLAGAGLERGVIVPRRFCITPGDAGALWQHAGKPEIPQPYVRDSLYIDAAEEALGRAAAAVPCFTVVDPLLQRLAIAALEALRDGAADDRLYVETIARLIALHLARAQSAKSPSSTAGTDEQATIEDLPRAGAGTISAGD